MAEVLSGSGHQGMGEIRAGLFSRCGRSAARLASLSISSLPCVVVCPAVQRNVREYLGDLRLFSINVAVFKKSAAMCCPGCVSSVDTTFTAAWLSATIANDVRPACSVFMRCRPNTRPTSSASYTILQLLRGNVEWVFACRVLSVLLRHSLPARCGRSCRCKLLSFPLRLGLRVLRRLYLEGYRV